MGYVYLAIAIAGELIGTTFLKYSEGFTKLGPSIVTSIAYVICFYSFSKCLFTINLSVAYATWSAVGLIVTAFISVLIFKEGLTVAGGFAIAMITVGVIVLNVYGTPIK